MHLERQCKLHHLSGSLNYRILTIQRRFPMQNLNIKTFQSVISLAKNDALLVTSDLPALVLAEKHVQSEPILH